MKEGGTKFGWVEFFSGIVILVVISQVLNIDFFILLLIFGFILPGIGEIYVFTYFKGEKFLSIKESINYHIQNCNDLNYHIEELKQTYLDVQSENYGKVSSVDNSNYNFQRRDWGKIERSNQVYNCSLSVCRNVVTDPFKYLCKYFNVETNETSLNKFSEVLNNFSSAEEGKKLLLIERKEILDSISNEIPKLFRVGFYNQRFIKKLGFHQVDLSTSYFPTFSFQYVSAGGNSSLRSDIVFDIQNLNDFLQFIGKKIDYINSYQGQRALMTSSLREYIKNRDEYKCCSCGNGTENEPNLLLEIDHILPLSKGGLTKLKNLQTLCWRCNRSKGSKIVI